MGNLLRGMSGKKRERSYLKNIFLSIIDTIYPSYCKICDKKLKYNEKIVCNECISSLDYKLLRKTKIKIDNESYLFSVFFYEDIVKDFIHLFKYSFYEPIGKILTEKALNYIDNALFKDYNYLLPVPLSSKKKHKRGFNQTEIIAKIISDKTDIPLTNIIRKKSKTLPQSLLSKTERAKNLRGAFSLDKNIDKQKYEDKSILVIDDILTTGATFLEIKKTLKPLSFSKIDIFTLATPKF